MYSYLVLKFIVSKWDLEHSWFGEADVVCKKCNVYTEKIDHVHVLVLEVMLRCDTNDKCL